jgi:hypothetical protein
MKKRITSLIVLFAVLLAILPTQTASAAAKVVITETDKMTKTEATALIVELKQKIRKIELIDEKKRTATQVKQLSEYYDLWGNAHWRLYSLAHMAEWNARDSTFVVNGVKLPRPRSLWALEGYPQASIYYNQGVKIKSNWDVYLDGTGSNEYHLSVKNNVLKITGKNCVRDTHAYSVRGKFQLFKPAKGLDDYVGDDGLAYIDYYSCDDEDFVKNTTAISSNTLILSPDTAEGEEAVKDLSYEIDLSSLSDGLYCIKELIYNLAPDSHKAGQYWWELVVVVHEGKASLQATDICWGEIPPKAPEGRITYGKWYPNAYSCTDGDTVCLHF